MTLVGINWSAIVLATVANIVLGHFWFRSRSANLSQDEFQNDDHWLRRMDNGYLALAIYSFVQAILIVVSSSVLSLNPVHVAFLIWLVVGAANRFVGDFAGRSRAQTYRAGLFFIIGTNLTVVILLLG